MKNYALIVIDHGNGEEKEELLLAHSNGLDYGSEIRYKGEHLLITNTGGAGTEKPFLYAIPRSRPEADKFIITLVLGQMRARATMILPLEPLLLPKA